MPALLIKEPHASCADSLAAQPSLHITASLSELATSFVYTYKMAYAGKSLLENIDSSPGARAPSSSGLVLESSDGNVVHSTLVQAAMQGNSLEILRYVLCANKWFVLAPWTLRLSLKGAS